MKNLDLWQKAIGLHQQQKWEECLKALDALLKQAPKHIEALRLKGNLLNQLGRTEAAIKTYQIGLKSAPHCFEINHELGRIYWSQGNHHDALPLFQAATTIAKQNYQAWVDLGVTYQVLGRSEEAINALENARTMEPDRAETLDKLGVAYASNKNETKAIECFERAIAINPNYLQALCNYGAFLSQNSQPEKAITYYERALEINPNLADANSNIGILMKELGKIEEGIKFCKKAIEMSPGMAEAYSNLALLLKEKGELDEAIEMCNQALKLDPKSVSALNNLGNALQDKNEISGAIEIYTQALNIDPNNAKAHSNLGNALQKQDALESAILAYEKALSIQPNYALAFNNLGNAYLRKGDVDGAIANYQKAIDADLDYPEAVFHISMAYLLKGELEKGFRYYEYRWQMKEFTAKNGIPDYKQPQWQGEHLSGETVLLVNEQGFGDRIQFIRYASSIVERGGKVLYECPQLFLRLFATYKDLQVLIPEGCPRPDFNYFIPLQTLPHVLETQLDSIPCPVPYLFSPSEAKAELADKIRSDKRLKIGIVWASSLTHKTSARRSIPLQLLIQLSDLPDVELFSLQKEMKPEDAEFLKDCKKIIDLRDYLDDFADTATAIDRLDLVITVDTAVAHLAGALGRPVWVLLPFMPDWRWMLDRDDSPWYPSVRLFRQPHPKDWSSVIENVKQALIEYVPSVVTIDRSLERPLSEQKTLIEELLKRSEGVKLSQKALAAYESADYSEASFYGKQVLEIEPHYGELLNLMGVSSHKLGDSKQGAEYLQRALEIEPNNADFHGNLGLVLDRLGDNAGAVEHFLQAIEGNPSPELHNNLANSYQKLGQYHDAISHYRLAIESGKQDPKHFYNLANTLKTIGEIDEAIDNFKKAIALNPNYAKAYDSIGLIYVSQENYEQAIENYHKAIELEPQNYIYHVHLGNALAKNKQHDEAKKSFEKALEVNGGAVDAYRGLSAIYLELKDSENAIKYLEEGLKLTPDCPNTRVNLAVALIQKEQYNQAENILNEALAIRPGYAEAICNLGVCANKQQKYAKGCEYFEQAIGIKPDLISAHLNYGLALAMQEKMIEAVDAYRAILKINPEHPDAHMNVGIALLALGNLKEGWAEYEWRHRVQEYNSRVYRIPKPVWNGKEFRNKTLLIYTEQGLGDCIQFIRYIPIVKSLGGKVIVEANQELLRNLLNYVPGIDEVYAVGDVLPDFDFHYPLMSLPHLFGTNLDNIPAKTPYFSVPKELLELPIPDPSKLKVGIVWTANLGNPTTGKKRTIPFVIFQTILQAEGVQFYILQKDILEDEKPLLAPYTDRVINLSSMLNDLTDTAALVQQLDLVITVDTMIAHLAGALNVPVWIVLPYAPDWRWLLDREDSPWYRSVRLFRSRRDEEWHFVLQRALQQLTIHNFYRQNKQERERHLAIINQQPDNVEELNDLGVIEMASNNIDSAVAYLRKAVELNPSLAEVKMNLGNALLHQKEWKEGFALYLFRLQVQAFTDINPLPSFSQPCWDGEEDISTMTLYVYPEQGYGDQIQFIRYLSHLRPRVGRIIYGCTPALFNLMRNFPHIDQLVKKTDQEIEFDRYVPLGNLPHICGQIDCSSPYLTPSPETIERWQSYFQNIDSSIHKIGVVWQTKSKHPTSSLRSISLGYFYQLFNHPDSQFFILQPQIDPEDRKILAKFESKVTDFSQQIQDFADTAAIIHHLDLVITIDTSVAHLAGALGKATWILLPYSADWRWEYTWYPSVYLFRQSSITNWQALIDRVYTSLDNLIPIEETITLPQPPSMSLEELLELAITAYQNKELSSAITHLEDALKIVPDRVDLLLDLGSMQGQFNQLEAAVKTFNRVLEVDPDNQEAKINIAKSHFNLGNYYNSKDDHDRAIDHYQTAVKYNPALAKAHTNLGIVYGKKGDLESAISSYQKAIELEPNHAEIYNNMASSLHQNDREHQALESYQQAININPNFAEAHSGLASIYRDVGDFESALEHHNKAIEINPAYANAHFNLAQTLLLSGNFEQGLKEYEWRFKSSQFLEQGFVDPKFPQPLWDGSRLDGKTIFVMQEQGIGDQIQFIRYCKLLKEKGAKKVIYNPPESLTELFQSIAWIDELITTTTSLEFDCWVSLMSLPYYFQTNLANIPQLVPYLSVPFEYQERSNVNQLFVGLCWATRSASPSASRRSISLQDFIPLLQLTAVNFTSLQKEVTSQELEILNQHQVTDRHLHLTDFWETAKLIQSLDLVITVDTAVAHLSAALGKPTWILVNKTPDWRWLNDREDSPWYPTVRLFRQTTINEWTNPILKIKDAIELLKAPPTNSPEFSLATEHYQNNQPESARSLCHEILRNDPQHGRALHLLGVIEVQQKNLTEAINYLFRSITYLPGDCSVCRALGAPLVMTRHLNLAISYLFRSLELEPNCIYTIINIGSAYNYLNRVTDSLTMYEQAIKLSPQSPESNLSRSLCLLKLGDYENGFREYEWRWQKHQFPSQPRWDGCSLEGKTILVCAEQGAGDQIQFWRFLGLLKNKGASKVICGSPFPLVSLCQLLPAVDQIIVIGQIVPQFDYWIPLLSLPFLLGITLTNLPTSHKYLVAPQGTENLVKKTTRLKVGLVWECKKDHETYIDRSIPLHFLQPLLDIQQIDFYLLQKEISNEDLAFLDRWENVTNLQPHLVDFGVTASIIEHLDLIITVDTAVAHLGGGLGKPTWVMLPFACDWRWLDDIEYSPWYPSIWLFRQPNSRCWQTVVREVVLAITKLLATPQPEPHFSKGLVTVPYFNSLTRRGSDVVLETLRSIELAIAYFYSHYLESWKVSIEVALVDDNSSDETFDFLSCFSFYKSDYKAIKVFKPSDTANILGAGFPRNQGVNSSQADLLFFCDDDDCYLEKHIYTLFLAMNSPIVSSDKSKYKGLIDNLFISATYTSAALEDHIKVHPYWIKGISCTIPLTKCVQRRLHNHIGGFPTDIATEEDVVYTNLVRFFASVIHIDEVTALYKHYPGNALDRQLIKFSAPPGEVSLSNEDLIRNNNAALAIQKSLNKKLLSIKGKNYTGLSKRVTKIAIAWKTSLNSDWGVFGTNLSLQLLAHPEYSPFLLSPDTPGSGHYNPLAQKILSPLLNESHQFYQLVSQNPNGKFRLDVPIIHALGNGLTCSTRDKFMGEKNIGFIFFENTLLNSEDKQRAELYDVILAGSSWNSKILKQNHIDRVHTVLQGVDPTLFHPAPKSGLYDQRFVIFSGGKIEFRKGQDIVIAAFKRFHKHHPDALLVFAWHNFWSQFMLGMDQTGNVRGLPQKKDERLDISSWLVENGLSPDSFYDVGLVPNYLMPLVYREADVALFPNRCEGGTNLVAMECLACGVPTILSANTGHLDLIDESHCYPLTKQRSVPSHPIFPGTQDWGESDVDEVVEMLERIYTDRENARKRGARAVKFMENLTWKKQIDRLLSILKSIIDD